MLVYIVESSFLNENRKGEDACLTQPRIFTSLISAVRYIDGKLLRKVTPVHVIKATISRQEKLAPNYKQYGRIPMCLATYKSSLKLGPNALKKYGQGYNEQIQSIYVAKI